MTTVTLSNVRLFRESRRIVSTAILHCLCTFFWSSEITSFGRGKLHTDYKTSLLLILSNTPSPDVNIKIRIRINL